MGAELYNMSEHEAGGGAPHPEHDGYADAKRGPKRERRKPRVDGGSLTALYKDYAYLEHSDIVWCRPKAEPVKLAHLRAQYGNDAVRIWLQSPARVMITKDEVVFDPEAKCPKHWINLFRGRGVEPAEGDVGPYLDLVRHVCADDDNVIDYLLNWLAYPIQKPGAKMNSAVIMHGDEGSGKNFVFEPIVKIHGLHGRVVGQTQLESQWNDWASAVTFLIGDEVVSRTEMRHHKGTLKALVTSANINIQTKFMNTRVERNCMNMVFLSNETQPLVLDNTDRRYCVIWTPRNGEVELYKRYVAWRDAGGIAALHHMLATRDLSAWDWWSPPPMTDAKQDLIELGRLSPERFVRDWQAGAIGGLPWRACSADQAFQAYQAWCSGEGERWPMAKPQFSRLASRQAPELRVQVVKMIDGTTQRVWLPCAPVLVAGQTMGDWATSAVAAFAETLSAWRKARNPWAKGVEA